MGLCLTRRLWMLKLEGVADHDKATAPGERVRRARLPVDVPKKRGLKDKGGTL